jgi:dCMP deaminase
MDIVGDMFSPDLVTAYALSSMYNNQLNTNVNPNSNNEVERKRPSWREYFKNIVLETCKRSPCERLQVGCLFVKDNRIISQGYNGFLSGCHHKSIVRDNHEQATIHAEQNAITDCAKRGVSCDGCDAYITHYPCIICMRLLCASGIKRIYYINDYKNDELVEYFSNLKNIVIEKI